MFLTNPVRRWELRLKLPALCIIYQMASTHTFVTFSTSLLIVKTSSLVSISVVFIHSGCPYFVVLQSWETTQNSCKGMKKQKQTNKPNNYSPI